MPTPKPKPRPKPKPGAKAQTPARLWRGPTDDGITFSMLSRYLVCKERFRVAYVEGWKPADQFNHKIEYGQMWHTCEEAHAGMRQWAGPLREYTEGLCRKYPLAQEQVVHWYNVCRAQFPVYADHWRQHPDVVNRTPLLQEHVFDVPYRLPSGRTVRLRGKWDSVDLVGTGAGAGIYLQENKTKGDVDVEQIKRQLTFDLQTMLYMVAMTASPDQSTGGGDEWALEFARARSKHPIGGVLYNVVRRPLSGGEGNIVRRKGSKNVPPETGDEYYGRLGGVFDGTGKKQDGSNYTGPEYWFTRFKAEVGSHDLDRFRSECLDPILESLCNWWQVTTTGTLPARYAGLGLHWRHPYGVYNVLDEGGHTDLDAYLDTGSTVGLVRRAKLFEELEHSGSA